MLNAIMNSKAKVRRVVVFCRMLEYISPLASVLFLSCYTLARVLPLGKKVGEIRLNTTLKDLSWFDQVSALKEEIRRLNEEIKDAKKGLKEERLKCEQLLHQVKRLEDRNNQQQKDHDQQLSDVVSKLLLLEGQFRKEQQDIQNVMCAKDRTINEQRQQIKALLTANNRLLAGLAPLRSKTELKVPSASGKLGTLRTRLGDRLY